LANFLKREVSIELEFIVDTGTIYTVMSKCIVEKHDLKITSRLRFKLVSDDVVEYSVAKMNIEVEILY